MVDVGDGEDEDLFDGAVEASESVNATAIVLVHGLFPMLSITFAGHEV